MLCHFFKMLIADMIENYLQMAKSADEFNNNEEAENYCNKILEIDPKNYTALILKGKLVLWQSSLDNLRLDEGVRWLTLGIENVPNSKKDDIVKEVIEIYKHFIFSVLNLTKSNFSEKRLDENALQECLNNINSIISSTAILSAAPSTRKYIDAYEILIDCRPIINSIGIEAWNNFVCRKTLLAVDWSEYENAQICTEMCLSIFTSIVSIYSNEFDEINAAIYENIIYIAEKIIDFEKNFRAAKERYVGNILDEDGENLIRYYGEFTMGTYPYTTKQRKKQIAEYKEKLKKIEDIKLEKEKEEARIKEEEAKKRFDEYWTAHAEEKVALEKEQKELSLQVDSLNQEIEKNLREEEIKQLQNTINSLIEEKVSLGLFKVKEKKALQEKIDTANYELKKIQDEVKSVKAEIQNELTPLQERIDAITIEMTKER